MALVVVAGTVGWLMFRGEDSPTGSAATAPATRSGQEVVRRGHEVPVARYESAVPSSGSSDGRERAAPGRPGSTRSVLRPEDARTEVTSGQGPPPDSFDDRALEEAGYRRDEVEVIRRRWEEAETTVRAAREGIPVAMPMSPQREKHVFDSAMREVLGDEDYDAGRFATGRDNRVEILWVSDDELSAATGLRPGDRIVAYNGRPVYTTDEYFDLRRQDRASKASEYSLTVERDGYAHSVVVPEGDVWLRFKNVRVPPR